MHVAMQDSRLMQPLEPDRRLEDIVAHLAPGELAVQSDQFAESHALDEIHHQVGRTVLGPGEGPGAYDVRVIDLAADPRLAFEPQGCGGIGHAIAADGLECDARSVIYVAGFVDPLGCPERE